MTIAVLTTGDEIVHGDTLNTNGYHIAQTLSSEGLSLGLHMSCSDKEKDLLDCLRFLTREHDILIITGGLGPTSDDRTRFALAKFVNQPLIEYPEALKHIEQRLKPAGSILNPGNRQQALFPAGISLLPNLQGTATGCYYPWQDKLFILLPGPPRECLPMFHDQVMPLLRQRQHSDKEIMKWLIFGVAESQIAEKVDKVLADLDCKTGYRLDTPYIELKVRCKSQVMERVKQRLRPLLSEHIISSPEKKASQELKELISLQQKALIIRDEVTGGLLQTLIQTPENCSLLHFCSASNELSRFHLSGLDEYWQKQPQGGTSQLRIHYRYKKQEGDEIHHIPYRSPLVIYHAAEWLSFRLSHFIKQLDQGINNKIL